MLASVPKYFNYILTVYKYCEESLFTFGLLASSLVMLSAMPLLNNNTAMGQEYGGYKNDNYSNYPTQINKYECQTGPFEGFYVESVEFCKIKLPIGSGMQGLSGSQGPQGPQGPPGLAGGQPGPQGPPGPQGLTDPQGERGLTGATGMTGPVSNVPRPQGPAGITFLNGTNLYRLTGPVDTAVQNGQLISSFIECDSGDSPVNGFSLVNTVTSANLVYTGTSQSGFNLSVLPTGFTTAAVGTIGDQVVSFVTCFDNPPAHIP